MPDQPEVPESLLQLEGLRVLSVAYYGASRALTERANDLRRHRRSLEQDIQDLANYFDGSQPHIMPGERRYTSRGSVDATVKAKTEAARQQIAAIAAMLEIVRRQSATTMRTGAIPPPSKPPSSTCAARLWPGALRTTEERPMPDFNKDLSRLRSQITAIKEQLQEQENGVLPKAAALQRAEANVYAFAADADFPAHHFLDQERSHLVNPMPHGVDGTYALLCKLFPERIIDLLKGEIEAAYSRGLTIADDNERSKLEAKLGELEHQEERAIREAAAAGVRIARRAGVNPEVLLAG